MHIFIFRPHKLKCACEKVKCTCGKGIKKMLAFEYEFSLKCLQNKSELISANFLEKNTCIQIPLSDSENYIRWLILVIGHCILLCTYMPGKIGNLGTWFPGNFNIWREFCKIKKYKEMEGNLAILEGNFDWVPRKVYIFSSHLYINATACYQLWAAVKWYPPFFFCSWINESWNYRFKLWYHKFVAFFYFSVFLFFLFKCRMMNASDQSTNTITKLITGPASNMNFEVEANCVFS